MKIHTTNYYNTFIQIADDCPVEKGEVPPLKEPPSVANRQFEIISKNPYKFTSDEVLFRIFAERNDILEEEYRTEKEKFFSKGQACFRSSPLCKRYGWGIHYNEEGKMALYGCESREYENFSMDKNLKVHKGMKSSK